MSKAFLRQLTKIPSYALPKDASCPICVQPYENQTTDSGSFEKALCLPCDERHIFGSECLLEWLRHGNTCPLCRSELVFMHDEHEDDGRIKEDHEEERVFWTYSDQRRQDWDEYWYITFWILRLHGDEYNERQWRQHQQDWIIAAKQWDIGIEAQTRTALLTSLLTPRRILDDERQVRVSAGAIQTLRFREYRLFLQLQPHEAERRELAGPPLFQLTPAHVEILFRELERRGAFKTTARFPTISRREQWNKLRDVGFVWNPEYEESGRSQRGRWSRYWY